MRRLTLRGKQLRAGLAGEINEQDALAKQKAGEAIEHARRCGELLLEAKAQLPHGQFLPWVAEHCEVAARQAQRYMRLAEGWKKIQANTTCETHLSVTKALEILAPEPAPAGVANVGHTVDLGLRAAVKKVRAIRRRDEAEMITRVAHRLGASMKKCKEGIKAIEPRVELTSVGLKLPDDLTEEQSTAIGKYLGEIHSTVEMIHLMPRLQDVLTELKKTAQ